jgi:hypothetical protein
MRIAARKPRWSWAVLASGVLVTALAVPSWASAEPPPGATHANKVSGHAQDRSVIAHSTVSDSSLIGVSCASAVFCMAVGSFASDVDHPLIESWNGIAWAVSPIPNSVSRGILRGVSCVSPTFCVAVGDSMIESWNGAAWTLDLPQYPPSWVAGEFQLNGVSCQSPTECVAAGLYPVAGNDGFGDGSNTLTEAWNGSTWSIVGSVGPSGGIRDDNGFDSISCYPSVPCQVVGYSEAHGGLPSVLAETWNGSDWAVSDPLPTYASEFTGNSCYANGCEVVGYNDNFALAPDQSCLVQWFWPAGPNSAGWAGGCQGRAGSVLNGISCLGDFISCVMVGYTAGTGNDSSTLAEGIGVPPSLSPTFASRLSGVSCTDVPVFSCMAVGSSSSFSLIEMLSSGSSGSHWVVLPHPGGEDPLAITTGSLPNAILGKPYSASVAATGGDPPYDWNLAGGSLPPGLTLNSLTGTFAGTPSTVVSSTFTIQVQDYDGVSATATFHIGVSGQPPPPPATSPSSSTHGYWLVGSDGGIFNFGSAQFYGSTGSLTLQRPVVGISPTASRTGYWLVGSDGGIFAFDTGFFGSIPGLPLNPAGSGLAHSLNAPIGGMVPSVTGQGYFMVASDGGVFAFGDAHFAGSCPGLPAGCSGAAVAVVPDKTGNGYWVVTKTGAVYGFGDAAYFGGPGPQSSPITSAVATPNGGGYYILDANGEVFAYGDATSLGGTPAGSTGGLDPAAAIFDTSDGGGYWISTGLGKVYSFGDAPNDGDMSTTHLNGSIIAATGW